MRTLLLSLALLGASAAHAGVLSFDDLPPGSYRAMPASYQGFGFSGWFHSDYEYPDGDPSTPWSPYQPASGMRNIFTNFADPSDPAAQLATLGPVISAAEDFVFDGAHVSGYSPVSFVLFLDGVEVHRSATLPLAPGVDGNHAFLASGYAGRVDGVAVHGVQGYYALDDFSFSAVSAVPEPGSLGLLGAGLGLLAWRMRRRAKQPAPDEQIRAEVQVRAQNGKA